MEMGGGRLMPYFLTTAEQIFTELGKNVNRRGLNVYTMSELMGVSGTLKDGKRLTGTVEQPFFGLSPLQRIEIFKLNSDVFGIVTSRMNRIAGLEWTVTKESKNEDRIEMELKAYNQLYHEFDGPDMKSAIVRVKTRREISRVLADIKDDLSNFDNALLRWSRKNKQQAEDRSSEIVEWLKEPNIHDNFDDYVKKYIMDLMVHGAGATYKEKADDGRLDNFYTLPGGTVLPMRSAYVGGGSAFVQILPGIQPRIYYQDEISYASYIPSSATSYGMVPLESLVNKIAESLMFDRLAAERSDGTVPPEKVVIFGDKSPFGDLGQQNQFDLPIDSNEQKRIETVLNEPRMNAIRTLTGVGTPLVMDLSKADTFTHQMARQDKIRESIALVYNTTNMEINLSGSDNTSGRSTSESQARIELHKGIAPTMKLLTERLNKDIIPQRFGSGYPFEFSSGLSEAEKLQMDRDKILSGTYAVNEVKIARGETPYPEEEYDRPQGAQQMAPDGSQESPFSVESI